MSDLMTVLHLRERPDGESYFDTFEVDLPVQIFAPPALPFSVSSAQAAARFVFIRIPVGWVGERHPSPNRQILFALAGVFKVTASDGDVRYVRPGDVWQMEDVSGRGHESEVVSDVPFDAAIVVLAA